MVRKELLLLKEGQHPKSVEREVQQITEAHKDLDLQIKSRGTALTGQHFDRITVNLEQEELPDSDLVRKLLTRLKGKNHKYQLILTTT